MLIASAIKSASVTAPVAVNDAVTGVVIVALPFNDSLTVNVNGPELNVVAVTLLEITLVAPALAL